ncbi:MAG: hypothetical protein RLZZ546_3067 [Bacteroidota bacterium]|jgi:uncharacterized RDD family membrane protein YckC
MTLATIDFKTSHNIVVSGRLASVFERMGAGFIDLIVLLFITYVLALIFRNSIITTLLCIPSVMMYSLLSEYFMNGQSLGKKILKLKVVSLSGSIPSISALAIRWTFRLVDIWFSSSILGLAAMSSSLKNQRLGDLFANTAVIKLDNDYYVGLGSLERMKEIDIDFKYPGVEKFSDDQMLIIKTALTRISEKYTLENKILLDELRDKISQLLSVDNNVDSRVFLTEVLREYVIKTR